MYFRILFVSLCVLASVGIIAKLPSRTQGTARSDANGATDVQKDEPQKASTEAGQSDDPAKPAGADSQPNVVGIASTGGLSRLAHELGFIDELPKPLDHRKPADAAKAAKAMREAFPKDKFGDYSFGVSTKDGHLIVHVSEDFLELDEDRINRRMGQYTRIWRLTKFTREYGFSPIVEFRARSGWTKTMKP